MQIRSYRSQSLLNTALDTIYISNERSLSSVRLKTWSYCFCKKNLNHATSLYVSHLSCPFQLFSLVRFQPGWTGEAQNLPKPQGNLEKPITSAPHTGGSGSDLHFKKPEWTKESGLQNTSKGSALKSGQEIARPIGGIKPVDEN